MLVQLHIENFAIIDSLDVELESSLVTFTGETGAGKSIIIDAVETILGGRADATQVRTEAQRANVEALFQIPESLQPQVHAILRREELLDQPDMLSMGREIRSNGRSIARVNGRVVM
jgi:DNA repair protein RecN (Recombination protein N)